MPSKHPDYDADDNDDPSDSEPTAVSLLHQTKTTVLKPLRLAASRPARRAYLTTALLILTALALLAFAIVAYTLFYWNYIPRVGFARTLHLQFDDVFPTSHTRHDAGAAGTPYGTVELGKDVVSGQRYDVRAVLELPRTRANREAGNFMVEAGLFASGMGMLDGVKEGLVPGLAERDNRIAGSRRPAMVVYRSLPLECLTRALQLPWYLLGWRLESETVTVGLWEGLEFERGWRNLPASMKVEIQSERRMQVYSVRVEWRARFRGLRWMMYNHRVISAVVFVSAFWMTELAFAGLAWAGVSFLLQSPPQDSSIKSEKGGGPRIKQEADVSDDGGGMEMSDTERTFPSSSKREPLRYRSPEKEGGPTIKQEFDDAPTKATEADDEDEDVDFVDSGLGTSMESSAARRDSIRRRRGRLERDE